MFGYITPCKQELKVKEFDMFRAVYCGLCKQLGKSFGMLSRLTLNYDFVFLAMLHYTQTHTMPEVYVGRCPVNPLTQVPLCKSDESMRYSADLAAIMVYYKVIDNIEDSGFFGKIGWSLTRPWAKRAFKKAQARQPEASAIVGEMMEKQRAVEEKNIPSVDAAAEPTATALAKIASTMTEDEDKREPLWRLGYLTGRYIYLCDAMDDLEKDLKRGEYNPYIARCLADNQDKDAMEQAREYAKDTLFFTISEIAGVSEELDFEGFAPILENIVHIGLLGGVKRILSKEGRKSHERSL